MSTIVLMYHDIYRNNPLESGFLNSTAIKYKIRADRFEDQVAMIDNYLQKNKLPVNTIEFTFDDGGESFLTVAAPILEKYGFRGIFYISTGYIGTKGFLDANQIKELSNRGHIVGSHSHSHPERMSALSENEVYDEWRISQMMLTEVLGKTPTYASIPNGYKSKEVLKAMSSVGISIIDTSAATTSQSHFNKAIIRGRYVITADTKIDDVMRIITSPIYRFKKSLRWQILSFAKLILGDAYLKIRAYFAQKR